MPANRHIFFNANKGVWAMFTIADRIKYKDEDLYKKLKAMSKADTETKHREVRLGDKTENLMKHDSYKRIGRRIKQVGWGGK